MTGAETTMADDLITARRQEELPTTEPTAPTIAHQIPIPRGVATTHLSRTGWRVVLPDLQVAGVRLAASDPEGADPGNDVHFLKCLT